MVAGWDQYAPSARDSVDGQVGSTVPGTGRPARQRDPRYGPPPVAWGSSHGGQGWTPTRMICGMKSSTTLPLRRWRAGTRAAIIGAFLVLAVFVPGRAVAQPSAGAASAPSTELTMRVCLMVGGKVATATQYDNATARDLASLLLLSPGTYRQRRRLRDRPARGNDGRRVQGRSRDPGLVTAWQ